MFLLRVMLKQGRGEGGVYLLAGMHLRDRPLDPSPRLQNTTAMPSMHYQGFVFQSSSLNAFRNDDVSIAWQESKKKKSGWPIH